jgi:hypothetical protein
MDPYLELGVRHRTVVNPSSAESLVPPGPLTRRPTRISPAPAPAPAPPAPAPAHAALAFSICAASPVPCPAATKKKNTHTGTPARKTVSELRQGLFVQCVAQTKALSISPDSAFGYKKVDPTTEVQKPQVSNWGRSSYRPRKVGRRARLCEVLCAPSSAVTGVLCSPNDVRGKIIWNVCTCTYRNRCRRDGMLRRPNVPSFF